MLDRLFLAHLRDRFAGRPGRFDSGHGLCGRFGSFVCRGAGLLPKGLHWDDIAAQQRRNNELGWRVAIEFGDPVGPLAERPFGASWRIAAGHPSTALSSTCLHFRTHAAWPAS